ncbi:hypothetical protein AOQ84DRAFT_412009 [Glonium stellatum]|uniref:Microtubule associated protein n=1 Tax=Glonium stellatum TaxID=574774 RepID=A0A8E2FAX8_9PEZI|nr:hypothetical protein AOQ84DRAFT_412009 [Glonium stellatum]
MFGDPASPKSPASSRHEDLNRPETSARRVWRKAYRSVGFNKGYNLPFFIIFAGAVPGFCLSRLQYLNAAGDFASNTAPSEWYCFHTGHYRIGLTLHLATALPAGLLMVWQFVSFIRHRCLLFHRLNGYIVVVLLVLSNVGALMIAGRAFGGDISTQAAVGVPAFITSGGLAIALYNIKRLQIDQHRTWMLRTMVWAASIITGRILLRIAPAVANRVGSYYAVASCNEIAFEYGSLEAATLFYPQCAMDAVNTGMPENISTNLGVSFGVTVWISLFLHMVGMEVYIALTPAESERLRVVSYEKQLEAGFDNPGSAGLTIERWGDATTWAPPRTAAASGQLT